MNQNNIERGCTFRYTPEGTTAAPCDGCFKLHETPWMAAFPDHVPTDIFEVRFKNTRRSYYQNINNLPLKRGDIVAVESSPGHDIGIISLTGDMVARQMRRVGFNPLSGEFKKIYRLAKPYDIEKWQEAIALEHETMITSRQIAAEMGLNMKIGDVEYQGDKIKAIFYYIADERVDFRELIKVFAERFHIRIEMKQIGARQEAGRIGGIGACGRELCCASWIANFSSVTIGSARMQEISPNPQKLAGQCSKLKCCLAYEYDVYADARRAFPRLREPLQAVEGEFFLFKSDILAGTMTFSSSKDSMSNLVTLPISRVREILALNRVGKKVDRLSVVETTTAHTEEPTYRSGSDEDSITRFDNNRRRSENKGRRRSMQGDRSGSGQSSAPSREREQGRGRGAGRPDGNGESRQQRRDERPRGEQQQRSKQQRTDERPRGEQQRTDEPPRQEPRPENNRPKKPEPELRAESAENIRRQHRNDRYRNEGRGEAARTATNGKQGNRRNEGNPRGDNRPQGGGHPQGEPRKQAPKRE